MGCPSSVAGDAPVSKDIAKSTAQLLLQQPVKYVEYSLMSKSTTFVDAFSEETTRPMENLRTAPPNLANNPLELTSLP